MAALTDLEFIAMEAPALGAFPLTKNGVTFSTATTFFQALLDSNGSCKELALAQLFRLLTTEDRAQSLTLDQFSYTQRTGMTFDQAREYWESRYRQTLLSATGCAPTIQAGGCFAAYPPPPAVR